MNMERKNKFGAMVTVKKVFMDTDSIFIKGLHIQGERGRKRKFSSPTPTTTSTIISTFSHSFVFTKEWREAFIRNAVDLPVDLLIEEFDIRYHRADTASGSREQLRLTEEETTAAATEPAIQEDNNAVFPLPRDCVEIVLLKLSLVDFLCSQFVCREWADIWCSESLRRVYEEQRTKESYIVVNNNGLEFCAYSVSSMRWFNMNIPCDSWNHKSVRTLGVKAACSGLFLVAASDLALYVVNPLTKRCRRLPSINSSSTLTRRMKQSTMRLFVGGVMTLMSDATSGEFAVYIISEDADNGGNDTLEIIAYKSPADSWTTTRLFRNRLAVNLFPPWSRFYNVRCTACVKVSVTPQDVLLRFLCCRGADMVLVNVSVPLPLNMKNEKKEPGAGLPTTVNCDSGIIMVGRIEQQTDQQEELYGRLPIICHGVLGLWQMVIQYRTPRRWKFLSASPYSQMKEFVKTSQGTDVLVTGDGHHMIWFILRGSTKTLQYDISDNQWNLLPGGCPGSSYFDANMAWKAVYGPMTFHDMILI